MLHRIVDWLGYKLHIKKYTTDTLLQDLIGIVIAISVTTILLKTIAEMKLPPLPWYKRLWYWLKFKACMARATIIGY